MDWIKRHPELARVRHFELYCLPELVPFYEDMGPDGVTDYWRRKNTLSIDGKPTGVLDED